MCNKQLHGTLLVMMVLTLTGSCLAASIHWDGVAADRDFSNPENWSTGVVPGPGDSAFQWPPGQGRGATTEGPIIDEPVTVQSVGIGWKWAGATEDTPTVVWEIVRGGELTVAGAITIGRQNAWGQLDINGGTVTVNGPVNVGTGGNSVGTLNLDGGTLIANGGASFGDNGQANVDIEGGTLIVPGDQTELVQVGIDNGLITFYEGEGTPNLAYDETANQTTLTALHPLNPVPADSSAVGPGAVELSWTLPDPCVPGEAVPVDVYFTDDYYALWSFTNPEAIRVVSKENVTSVVVQAQPKTQYYWAVDAYLGGVDPNNNPKYGSIFSFYADNLPPEVDAGADAVTWLVDGVMTKNLDATVTDDDAYTVQWTVVSEPNDPNSPDAVIADPIAEDTSVTLSALGEYVLQLEASGGEYSGSDTVTINVYNDGCEAAQSLPDYVAFPGDLNGDCKVDELDLAILEEDWLKDNSLTEP